MNENSIRLTYITTDGEVKTAYYYGMSMDMVRESAPRDLSDFYQGVSLKALTLDPMHMDEVTR